MSYIAKRGLSSLIPPKIASPANLGANPKAKQMNRVVNFYKGLPTGAAPKVQPKGFSQRYYAKYIETGSGKPILHAVFFFLTLGYSMDYFFHLRHEHEHHE